MNLPVTSEVLLAEMTSAKAIIEAWITRVNEGIPCVDLPASEDQLENFLRSFCGELLIVSHKCESLSNVLSGEV